MDRRPLMSGFRGVLIYIAPGLALTSVVVDLDLGLGLAVGIVFVLSAMVLFPWLAGRVREH